MSSQILRREQIKKVIKEWGQMDIGTLGETSRLGTEYESQMILCRQKKKSKNSGYSTYLELLQEYLQ